MTKVREIVKEFRNKYSGLMSSSNSAGTPSHMNTNNEPVVNEVAEWLTKALADQQAEFREMVKGMKKKTTVGGANMSNWDRGDYRADGFNQALDQLLDRLDK